VLFETGGETTLLINAVKEQQEQIEEFKSAVARPEAAQP
jgi:hypothetical protein